MSDLLTECYNLLGLRPGASSAELKAAHRDLAKVWHPDRFHHDPRLQQKAEEKLKEINEAYNRLRSGKGRRQTPPASTRERHTRAHSQTVKVGVAQTIRWHLILVPVVIFVVAFLAASRSLFRTGQLNDQTQTAALEQVTDADNPERRQAGSRVNNSASEVPQVRDRMEARSRSEVPGSESASKPNAVPSQPMSTVTVVIDPTSGMIARSYCPVKTRMTYPSGSEPHQYCTSHKAPPIPPLEVLAPTDSRLKSAAKRLASPTKWFGDKAKSDTANKPDPKSP